MAVRRRESKDGMTKEFECQVQDHGIVPDKGEGSYRTGRDGEEEMEFTIKKTVIKE